MSRKIDIDMDEVRRLVSEDVAEEEIASRFGCSRATLQKRMRETGISYAHGNRNAISKEELSSMVNQDMSDAEIGERYDIKASTVKKRRMELGVSRERRVEVPDKEFRHLVTTYTDTVVAEKLGCSASYVEKRRKRLGIKKSEYDGVSQISRETVVSMTKDGRTPDEIAEACGCSKSSVYRIKEQLGYHHADDRSLTNDELHEYLDEGLSDEQIAERTRYSRAYVQERRLAIGIKHQTLVRTPSDEEMRHLVVDKRLSDEEIATRYGVRTDTIRHKRCKNSIMPHEYSSCEGRVKKILEELGLEKDKDFLHNARKVISPYGIDFYIPEKRIGIEVSPTYTHASDPIGMMSPKEQKYHQMKSLMALESGINLITVYDWYDLDIVRSILMSSLGMNRRIGARKCDITYPNVREERDFLEANHLRWYIRSEYAIGLQYHGRLVCFMSFARPRFSAKADGEIDYELLRFSSLAGVSVIGGASRLLKHAIDDTGMKGIISYASLDISNGNMYEKLGFEKTGVTALSYMWMNPRDPTEHYSWMLILNKGVDNVLGTHFGKGQKNNDLMRQLGYVRVFNSGNLVFVRKG